MTLVKEIGYKMKSCSTLHWPRPQSVYQEFRRWLVRSLFSFLQYSPFCRARNLIFQIKETECHPRGSSHDYFYSPGIFRRKHKENSYPVGTLKSKLEPLWGYYMKTMSRWSILILIVQAPCETPVGSSGGMAIA